MIRPKIFSDKFYKAKPIATKSMNSNNKNFEFIQNQIFDLLRRGIDRCSTSPWRAQTFDGKGQKRRMVIDYSMAHNFFTSLGAFPFPNMEALPKKASEIHFFSKIEIKSAYHQVCHIVSAGSERPDTGRLRTLKEYPVPNISKLLQCLI